MRHRKAGRNLSRNSEHRLAMMRNLVTSFLDHERLETTSAKAKELRILAEKIITLAKKGDLHARRQALSVVRSKKVVGKLFGEIKERFTNRPGGYTRIVPKGVRLGDGAPVSIIELLERPEPIKKGKKKKAAAAE